MTSQGKLIINLRPNGDELVITSCSVYMNLLELMSTLKGEIEVKLSQQ